MPVDFLKELNLPMLNVESLKKVVNLNTSRLIDLIKEHNYYIKKNNINLPGYKDFTVSVSDIGENSHLLEKPTTHNDMVNGNETLKNSQKNNSDGTYVCVIKPCNGEVDERTECSFVPQENFQELSNCDLVSSNLELSSVKCSSNKKVEPEVKVKTEEGPEVNERPEVSSEETPFLVISEVVGNADGAFYEENRDQETEESSLITPQKTKDITKIKGWRRKQFLVEKPTTVEFYSYTGKSSANKIAISIPPEEKDEEPGNVENAFVCDTLDEFLDRDAELKINYEIPHLYAEFGIKLTSEDVVSKPNLTEEDFKEVEMKYCVPIPPTNDVDWDLQDTKRGIKRQIEEDEDSEPSKWVRLNDDQRPPHVHATGQLGKPMLELSEEFLRLKNQPKIFQQRNLATATGSKELNKMNLVSKLIGLVVYPGLDKPLHPLVQRHLTKIRSYHTKIDENWANFAASAVLGKREFYKRRILPVYICGSMGESSSNGSAPELQSNDLRGSISKNSQSPSGIRAPENKQNKNSKHLQKKYRNAFVRNIRCLQKSSGKKPNVNLKECRVVIDKTVCSKKWALWCMDHNCYNCSQCGLDKFKPDKSDRRPRDEVQSLNKRDESVIASPQPSFDKEISALLAKTLRVKKRANVEISTSIDRLKNLTPNTVELIKLNFVKQSFLSGYISIWYLRAETSSVRSRAFLNFSDTPPVSNAINLKSCQSPSESLPKVITEIVSAENTFDSNEYAIMHCNGEVWEIHGCLNLAVGENESPCGKPDKEVEQIFASAPLPELRHLESLAWDILQSKTSKWWVLDLIQKFREIEIKSGSLTAVLSRKKFLAFIKLGLFGFISIRKEAGGRVLGAYIFQKLLPFVLIGPYRLFEDNGLTVKVDSSTVPFAYYGNKKTNQDNPLKFFIDSVITDFEENDKKIEGLWLHDKISLDNTCFLEVTMTSADGLFSRKQYSIEVEHSYGLKNLSSPFESGSEASVSKKDGKKLKKKFIVYLYFEIFDLGYVQGELLNDYSVVINHPLDQRTRVKSYKIGDLFIGIIKKRIRFIPNNLKLRWFITKHKDDLRGRQPFNKFYLGGAHILCKGGLYFMLQLTESKIEELGLNKNEVFSAIAESKVISEVRELKNLANILAKDSNDMDNFSMEDVLVMAIEEIEKQQKLEKRVMWEKNALLIKNSKLGSLYLKSLKAYKNEDESKLKMIDTLANKTEDLKDSTVNVRDNLKAYPFGRRFLRFFDRKEDVEFGNDSSDGNPKEGDSAEPKSSNLPFKRCSLLGDEQIIQKLENKLSNIQGLLETNTDSLQRPQLIQKLNCIFKQLNSIMGIFDETPGGEILKKRIRKNKNFIKLNDCVKSIQFLPKNIKVGSLDTQSPTTPPQPSGNDCSVQGETSPSAGECFQKETTMIDGNFNASLETNQSNLNEELPVET